MLIRVARHVAGAEKPELQDTWFKQFLSIMMDLEFLPNSPTLMNAGKELGQLSACFLLPIEDDLSNIFEQVKQVALIHKSGGGTGIVFSNIRPKNSMVNSTHGAASGPVSFMRVFDTATDVVKQGGVRRGANMGILAVNHPDILDFITCKANKTAFTNFNLSVAITDNFLKAVEQGNGFPLRNPHTQEKTYVKARDIFDTLCHQAWLTGEPGLIFIDTINAHNVTPWLGRIEGTNPCGEQPLLPYESCNLGSIDLSKLVVKGKIDWDRLVTIVAIAVRFLDDVIEVNKFPTIKIERKTKMTRKIGLGVMGWADMLIKLGIRYDSDQAIKLAKRLMMTIRETAHMTSRDLGTEKGMIFPLLKRRNATLTTVAPTGTLSLIANCSSGIEPLFSKNYTKTVMGDLTIDMSEAYAGVDPNLMVTSVDLTVEHHIATLAAFQEYTDNAVSKTIILPETAKVADVKKAFLAAHAAGCKGITVYRNKSREDAPLQDKTFLSECTDGKCQI